MAKEPVMKNYRLGRRFSDGRGTVHPVGAILSFEEGKAPSTAKLVPDKEAEPAEQLEKPKDKPTTLSEMQKKQAAPDVVV